MISKTEQTKSQLMLHSCISVVYLSVPSIFAHFPFTVGSQNTYELLNLRALKFPLVNKIYIFQSMGKIICVEFQMYPLKFHPKYLTHTLKDVIFIQHRNFKSS